MRKKIKWPFLPGKKIAFEMPPEAYKDFAWNKLTSDDLLVIAQKLNPKFKISRNHYLYTESYDIGFMPRSFIMPVYRLKRDKDQEGAIYCETRSPIPKFRRVKKAL